MNRLLLLLFYLMGSFWGTSLFANSIEGLSLLGERNSPTKPPKTLTPEITCSITGGGGLSRQVVCFGDSLGLGTVTDGEDGTARWYGQTTGGQWTALDSALVTKRKWAGAGIYKAVWTFPDSSSCTTDNDTVSHWKAFDIEWQVAACRANILSADALPLPGQYDGEQEVSYPINPMGEISYSWQVIPEPTQSQFITSSNSIISWTDSYFTSNLLGIHKVVLTVSQQGNSCISVDTMVVDSLNQKNLYESDFTFENSHCKALLTDTLPSNFRSILYSPGANIDSTEFESSQIAHFQPTYSTTGVYSLTYRYIETEWGCIHDYPLTAHWSDIQVKVPPVYVNHGLTSYGLAVGSLGAPWSAQTEKYTYAWFKNGSPFQNGNQMSAPDTLGPYYVIATDSLDCQASDTLTYVYRDMYSTRSIWVKNQTYDTVRIGWDSLTSVNHFVVLREGKPIRWVPEQGKGYGVNNEFGTAFLGGGYYGVFMGTGGAVNVRGLVPNKNYFVAVYAWRIAGGDTLWDTTHVQQRFKTKEIAVPKTLEIPHISGHDVRLKWVRKPGLGVILAGKMTDVPTASPVDSTDYEDSLSYVYTGSTLSDGSKILYKGTLADSVIVGHLDSNTVYQFKIWYYRTQDGNDYYGTTGKTIGLKTNLLAPDSLRLEPDSSTSMSWINIKGKNLVGVTRIKMEDKSLKFNVIDNENISIQIPRGTGTREVKVLKNQNWYDVSNDFKYATKMFDSESQNKCGNEIQQAIQPPSVLTDPIIPPYAPYGASLTSSGELTVLMLFKNFADANAGPGDNVAWPVYNSLPSDLSDHFYMENDGQEFDWDASDFTLSNFYFQMSRSSDNPFRVKFKALPVIIPSTVASTQEAINTFIQSQIDLGVIPPSFWDGLDIRNNAPNYMWDNSVYEHEGDGKIDYCIYFQRRDDPDQGANGNQGGTISGSYNSVPLELNFNIHPSSSGQLKRMYITQKNSVTIYQLHWRPWSLHKNVILHENSHSFFNSPHVFFNNSLVGNYFHATLGEGTMNWNSCNATSNPWETYFCGWNKPKTIIEANNGEEFSITDFCNSSSITHVGPFENFLRVKIPMITNQYLWLTHHSGLSNFDKGDELTDLYINEVIPDKGVYAMIDDMRTPTLNTTTSGIINGLRSIHKSGGVEFELKDFPLRPFNVFYGGLGKDCPTFGTPISSPFSFYNRRSLPKMKTPYQANANSFASNELVFPFIFDGGPDNSYRGTNHAFGNSGEIEELSINSGNPIFGHLTFNTANQDFSPMVFNGLAVYVYPRVANTDMKVGIRYDRNTFLVNQRLVGHFSLRPIPIFDGSSTPDLVIGENITISLDKMLNPNRTNKGSNNLYPDFITPSRFICKAGSVLELEEEATFIIENESGLVFESNSKIILAENSKIIIRSGCTFHAFDGCTLEVATGARIILEDNSFYCINPNLIYEGDNSSDIFRLGLNLGSTSPKLQPPYLVTPSSCSSVENFPLTFNCNSISIGGPASSFNLQKVGGAESSVSSPLSTSGLTDGQYHIISTNSTGLPGSYQSSFYIYGQSGAANFSSDHSFSNLVILNNNLSVSGGNIIIEPQTQVFVTGTPVNPTCAEPGFCPGYITGGDITLSGSARLDVRDGATFQGMCGNMWGGIAISDFAGLSAYNNMIFRDSYDGIETLGNEDNSDLIQLHVFNARFENNYKAIKQNDALDAFNFVRNSSFTSSHLTMKAPFNYSSGSPCLKFVSQRHLAYDHCMVNYGNLWNNSFANAQTGLEVGNASRGFNSVKNQFTNHYGKAIHLKSGSGVQLNFDQDVITLPNDLFFCEGDGETIPNFITPGSPYAKYGFFVEGLDNIPVIKSAVISGPTSFSSTGLFRNVGIYAHGGSFTTLTRCTLQNLNYGMVFYGSTASGTRTNSITENQFANNEQNLRFRNTYKSNFKLNLKCNTFTTPASPAPFTTRYGIWVEAGAEMPDIGGDLSPATPEKPAGNWWPVAGTTDPGIPPNWPITLNSGIDMEGWYSPIGWETVHNLTEDEWSYFQYKNEYLGPYFNPNGNPYFLPNIVDRVVRSRSDQVNSTAFVMDDACSNFGQILVFPTRPAISQDSTLTANVIAMQSGDQFLGQNIPNPSTSTTAIFYKLPDKSKRGRLEFFELGTGRIVKSIGIQVAGQGKIEFGLQGFANGIYGYRLFAEDKPVAWKKMIVAR